MGDSGDPKWLLCDDSEPAVVLRALQQALPEGCVVLVEGMSISADVRKMYERIASPGANGLPRDYISKKVPCYHAPATFEVLEMLASAFEGHQGREVCDHLKIAKSHTVLFGWHDVNCGGAAEFSPTLGKGVLRFFRQTFGFNLQRPERR